MSHPIHLILSAGTRIVTRGGTMEGENIVVAGHEEPPPYRVSARKLSSNCKA